MFTRIILIQIETVLVLFLSIKMIISLLEFTYLSMNANILYVMKQFYIMLKQITVLIHVNILNGQIGQNVPADVMYLVFKPDINSVYLIIRYAKKIKLKFNLATIQLIALIVRFPIGVNGQIVLNHAAEVSPIVLEISWFAPISHVKTVSLSMNIATNNAVSLTLNGPTGVNGRRVRQTTAQLVLADVSEYAPSLIVKDQHAPARLFKLNPASAAISHFQHVDKIWSQAIVPTIAACPVPPYPA